MGPSMRRALLAGAVVLLLAGCGQGTPPLTAYVLDFNRLAQETYVPLHSVWEEYAEIASPTPAELAPVLRMDVEHRRQAQGDFDDLRPPKQIAHLHGLFVAWHARLITDEEGLLARVMATGSWAEIEESEELTRYRATLDLGAVACRQFRTALAATEARGVFSEAAWVPGEMREVVDVALGCEVLLEALGAPFSA